MYKNLAYISLICCFLACKNTTSSSEMMIEQQTDISVAEAQTMLASHSAIFLDVRTPSEIAEGKIEDAVEIDFRSDDFLPSINELDKNKTYVVYCKSGGRSAKATKMMKKAEFKKVYNMLGGYSSWPNE